MSDTSVWTEGFPQADSGFVAMTMDEPRREKMRRRVTPNRKPASYYGLGAATCLVIALVAAPWGMILVWPALGLALLAVAYLDVGPGVFRKRAGRLPLTTRILFGPYLFGNTIAYWHCRRRSPGYAALTNEVHLGRKLNNSEAEELIERGLTAVLDLTAEYAECERFRGLAYKNVQILDLTLPTDEQISEAVEFVRRHATAGRVYIHCALGCYRAPSIAAAYLLAAGKVRAAEDAVAMVRRARPETVVPKGLIELLHKHYAVAAGD